MNEVFRRVLVPVELEAAKQDEVAVGESTVRALELAAQLARGGEVSIVHATPDFMRYGGWMSAERMAELHEDARRYSTTVLEAIAKQHCPGVTLRYVIEPGKALDVILQAASAHAVDVIVLAASARPRVNRAFLGSTADKVIRRSSCPVLVVPSGTA